MNLLAHHHILAHITQRVLKIKERSDILVPTLLPEGVTVGAFFSQPGFWDV